MKLERIPMAFFIFALSCIMTSAAERESKKVASVSRDLPTFAAVDIKESYKFLNDLKLSPLWKVEKGRDGHFNAYARSLASVNPLGKSSNIFLFEFLAQPDPILSDKFQLANHNLTGQELCTALRAEIIFQKSSDSKISFCDEKNHVTLDIYPSFGANTIDPNSTSILAVRLSKTHDIYLLVHEQGSDLNRTATFSKLPAIIQAAATIAELPKEYRTQEQYKLFYELFFHTPLKDKEIQRQPGLQDRDTFYGYFKVQPNTSYEGVNIKISHPLYCGGEGTRAFDRFRKAEYLGTPYHDSDLLFFLIEDNAVYLIGDYDKQFGCFSGKTSFDGKLEVLNDRGQVLLETTEKFKGWER